MTEMIFEMRLVLQGLSGFIVFRILNISIREHSEWETSGSGLVQRNDTWISLVGQST